MREDLLLAYLIWGAGIIFAVAEGGSLLVFGFLEWKKRRKGLK